MLFFFNKHTINKKNSIFQKRAPILQKSQHSKEQRLFQTLKAQSKRLTLNFIFSEEQRNFRNKLFKSVDEYCNFAMRNEIFIPSQSSTKDLQLSVKQTN